VYKPVSTKRKYTLAKWDLIKKSCMALRDTFEASKHKQPSSAEGLSLLSYLQKFNGGRELFIEEVAGWGSHVGELEEIDKFVSSGYSPYSCKKLSDIGVCTNRQSESCIKPISKQNIKASPIQFINKKNISETVYKNLINSLRRN